MTESELVAEIEGENLGDDTAAPPVSNEFVARGATPFEHLPMTLEQACNKHRAALKATEDATRAIADSVVTQPEAAAQAMLAVRHIEDARMRLGKVIQHTVGGGVSCFDSGRPTQGRRPMRAFIARQVWRLIIAFRLDKEMGRYGSPCSGPCEGRCGHRPCLCSLREQEAA